MSESYLLQTAYALVVLVFFLALILNAIILASATTITQTINDSQLPYFASNNITLLTNTNTTTIITHVQKSNIPAFTFDQVVSTATSNSVNISINFTIPFFVNLTTNPFAVNDTFEIKNNNTGNVTNVTFTTFVTFILPNLTQNITGTTTFDIASSEHIILRMFKDLLPFERLENITITAVPNITITPVCTGSLVECPSAFSTSAPLNTSTFLLKIIVPNGTLVGNYTNFIIFSQQNRTNTLKVDVEVVQGGEVIRDITQIINLDKCFSSQDEFIKCKQEQAKFEAAIAQKFLDEIQARSQCTNETIIEEKFVVVGEVQEALLNENSRLREENGVMTEQIIRINDDFLECQKEFPTSEDIGNRLKDELDKEKQTRLDAEEEAKGSWWTKLFLITFFGMFFWYGYLLYKSNWRGR